MFRVEQRGATGREQCLVGTRRTLMAQDGVAARTVEALPPPIEGPAVWYGPAMVNRTEWVHALSADDVTEIEGAMRPLVDTRS